MDLKAKIPARIAKEINASPAQVAAAIELLDGGATVPFVARYRKEVTGGLDDTQLRDLTFIYSIPTQQMAILAYHTATSKKAAQVMFG